MSVYKKVQIVCWSIVLVVLLGFSIWFLVNINSGSWNVFSDIESLNGPYDEVGRYSLDSSKIKNLKN